MTEKEPMYLLSESALRAVLKILENATTTEPVGVVVNSVTALQNAQRAVFQEPVVAEVLPASAAPKASPPPEEAVCAAV